MEVLHQLGSSDDWDAPFTLHSEHVFSYTHALGTLQEPLTMLLKTKGYVGSDIDRNDGGKLSCFCAGYNVLKTLYELTWRIWTIASTSQRLSTISGNGETSDHENEGSCWDEVSHEMIEMLCEHVSQISETLRTLMVETKSTERRWNKRLVEHERARVPVIKAKLDTCEAEKRVHCNLQRAILGACELDDSLGELEMIEGRRWRLEAEGVQMKANARLARRRLCMVEKDADTGLQKICQLRSICYGLESMYKVWRRVTTTLCAAQRQIIKVEDIHTIRVLTQMFLFEHANARHGWLKRIVEHVDRSTLN